jgi:hypothetical protein
MGVVDSIMFPGTLAFARFDYPSALPKSVQARMAEIATTVMEGLGFDNGLFNIEMMYDRETGRISIIEINPRMASQFADLYEKVDGHKQLLGSARYSARAGAAVQAQVWPHSFAASCVLRSFEDCVVVALPTEADLERLVAFYPDMRIELHGELGKKLSDDLQDGTSYRYGIINLVGAIAPMCSRDLTGVMRHWASFSCRRNPPALPRGAITQIKNPNVRYRQLSAFCKLTQPSKRQKEEKLLRLSRKRRFMPCEAGFKNRNRTRMQRPQTRRKVGRGCQMAIFEGKKAYVGEQIKMTKLVYIGGYGHSGSTLLEYLMTANPEVIACGEIVNARRDWQKTRKCSCGQSAESCPVWGPLFNESVKAVRRNHTALVLALLHQVADHYAIIVDSSKTAWSHALAPFKLRRNLIRLSCLYTSCAIRGQCAGR